MESNSQIIQILVRFSFTCINMGNDYAGPRSLIRISVAKLLCLLKELQH